MRKVTEVFLLAENRLLREVLIRLLSKRSEVRVVGANAYSPCVHHEIIAARPKIILLDSHGLSLSEAPLVSTLRTAIRHLRIVMVDMDPNEATFLAAIRSGVSGYVLKDASASEVAATICAVAAGDAVCPPSLCMVLFHFIAKQATVLPKVSRAADLGLSRREQEIVELLREPDQQEDCRAPESFGTNCEESCAPHSAQNQSSQSFQHRGTLREQSTSYRMESHFTPRARRCVSD